MIMTTMMIMMMMMILRDKINPFFSALVDVVEISGHVLVVVIDVLQVLHVIRVGAVCKQCTTSHTKNLSPTNSKSPTKTYH